jgi:choline-sulfatase
MKSPEIVNCPPLPSNLEIPKDEPSILRELLKKSPKQYPTVGWADEKWREYQWAYYRLIEKVDLYIGQILESLERNGYLDNTVIVFTSDHGDGCGSHRLNQKQVLYEEATNVPFIVSHLTQGKQVLNEKTLVNTGLDLIPTFLDYAGAKKAENLVGESVRELAQNGREYLFMETEFAQGTKSFGVMGRAVRDARYKYIVYSEGENREQLFDLKEDSGEMHNLSERKEYRKIKERMRQQLQQWQVDTGDSVTLLK